MPTGPNCVIQKIIRIIITLQIIVLNISFWNFFNLSSSDKGITSLQEKGDSNIKSS